MPVLTFARYILELSLMEYDLNVETSESMLATAVMYVALKVSSVCQYLCLGLVFVLDSHQD